MSSFTMKMDFPNSSIPTKHFCILLQAPLWPLISINFWQSSRKNTYLVQFWLNLHFIWCKFSIIIRMPELHIQKVLFKTNLVSNISTKE